MVQKREPIFQKYKLFKDTEPTSNNVKAGYYSVKVKWMYPKFIFWNSSHYFSRSALNFVEMM